PVPTALIISRFVEALTGKPMYDLSSHFACGAATYVFKDNGKMIPITRFIDVEGFLEYLKKKTEELRSGKSKTLVKLQLLTSI
ncbi:MAG: radical SAM protein, partial [Sulfolobales archaeon]|nr:radical SAM protein [Sulfolobales archaeon]